MAGDEPMDLFEPVMAAALRIATHPAIYKTPTPGGTVETLPAAILSAPVAVPLRSGERHWRLFLELCRNAECQGNIVQDAYLAALALEHGCRWITTDRDFARFPGLVWRHPMDGAWSA
jgi:toxin-antitoxin system PIN domain toxin